MAKTRSQTKRENDSVKKNKIGLNKLSKTIKQHKTVAIKVPSEMKCFVLIRKLSQADIYKLKGTEKELEKTYELRKREPVKVDENRLKAKKSLHQIVALSQMALQTSKAIRMWDVLKKQFVKSKVNLIVGQIVCGRMSGHRPWPAKIESFERNGVLLTFYGTNEKGIVKKAEIVPCEQCKEVLYQFLSVPISNISSKTLFYHMSFIKACKEINYVG